MRFLNHFSFQAVEGVGGEADLVGQNGPQIQRPQRGAWK